MKRSNNEIVDILVFLLKCLGTALECYVSKYQQCILIMFVMK